MSKQKKRKKKYEKLGIEAIVEPGVGALYVRGTWMKKLNELGTQKRKKPRKGSRNS